MSELGRMLVVFGVLVALVGVLLMWSPKIPLVGRLPGDIVWKRGNFTFYFPVATSILLSVVLTVLLWLCSRK